MKTTAFILMFISILSKIMGFVRELALSYYYGTSMVADAYIIATTVPFTIFNFATIGVGTSFIPLYNDIKNEYGMQKADDFTANITNIMLLISMVFMALGMAFAGPIVNLFAGGFEGETLELTVSFVRVIFLSLFAVGYGCIFRGYLNIKNNYVIPASIGFILNTVMITSIVLSNHHSVYILAYGACLAMILQFSLFIPSARKAGYRHKLFIDLKDRHIKELLLISLPVIFGMAISDINVIIDKTLASSVRVGGVATLNYAVKLNGFVTGIVVLSIGTVVFPAMSRCSAEGNMKGFKVAITEAINLSVVLIIPATVGFMIYSKPIVHMLFKRGQFNDSDVVAVAGGLFFYSLSLIGTSFIDTFAKAFYALKDTKTPVLNSIIMVIINIAASLTLSRFMGLNGLALGTSIAALSGGLMLAFRLRNRIGRFGIKDVLINFLKVLICSILMGGGSYLSFVLLTSRVSQNIALISSIGIAGLLYLVLIFIARVEGVENIKRELNRLR